MIELLLALLMALASALAPAVATTQPTAPAASVRESLEPTSVPFEAWTREGIASWMPERYGPDYLALPIGKGNVVELCGAGGCVTMTSTDAGPSLAMQRPPYNRIADLAVVKFEQICAVDRRVGLCPITWTLLKGRTR